MPITPTIENAFRSGSSGRDAISRGSLTETPTIRKLSRFLDVTVSRQGMIASNMANVDTPGYHTRDLNFRQELERADATDGIFHYASLAPVTHTVRGLIERPDGNNVNLEREGLLMAEVQLRFNIGVQLLRSEFHGLLSAIHEGSTA